MAITIFNNTVCPVCHMQLEENDSLFSFPAFVSNTRDPFCQFNDASFHLNCLQQHELGNSAIQFAEKCILETRPENRICAVGGNIIENESDYIFMGLLSSNEKEPLHRFNFLSLDKRNVGRWADRNDFIAIASEFKAQEKWQDLSDFKFLDYLIDKLKG